MSSFARRFGLAFCLVVSACADAETKPLPTGGSGGSGAGGSGGGGAAPFCGDGKIDGNEAVYGFNEIARGLQFLKDSQEVDKLPADVALQRFCLLTLNLNEFVFVD